TIAASTAMMAITTSSSIKVKARPPASVASDEIRETRETIMTQTRSIHRLGCLIATITTTFHSCQYPVWFGSLRLEFHHCPAAPLSPKSRAYGKWPPAISISFDRAQMAAILGQTTDFSRLQPG